MNSAAHDPAMVGKSGYERVANDAYYTPAWCTEALLRHVTFNGPVWECAAGDGRMSAVLQSHGIDVISSDIHPAGPGIKTFDFFTPGQLWASRDCGDIVTNPPYNLARTFIERALSITEYTAGKVAMLLRNEYDSASTRQHLFGNCPQFAMKLALTKRPKWFADDKASPRHNFSWFVWDWAHEGPPILRYDQ